MFVIRFAVFALCMILLSTVATSQAVAADKPNFIIIFIDDMGYGDIGPFGSEFNRTPNLDRMASEGMKLTSFYAAPVCSASRAQLLTGCYAPRVSVPGVFFPAGPQGLNPDEITVAEYLRDLGYATMCVGKWHLGDQPPFLPTNQGFDGYFGIPYSNDMGRPAKETGERVHPLIRDDKVAELLTDEDQRRITREYTEEAVRFIESKKEQPFFLYMPHTAMHVPLFPSPEFAGRSPNGTYGDWVEEVDWSVGQILETLKRLDIDDETMVLFTSDNGPWASKGKNGGVSGPLRGSKGCTLEGGVRVPTILRWPGKIAAGSMDHGIYGTTDVLPTLVDLAGGELDNNHIIDGISFQHLVTKRIDGQVRDEWFYYQGTQLKAIRSGNWKLAIAPQTLGMGIREKPEDLQTKEPRLYNLAQEIGEKTNLAEQYPRIVAKLQGRLEVMRGDIGSGKSGPGVRPPGKVENPVTLFPTRAKPRANKLQSTSNKPITWNEVKLGQAFSSQVAPAIAGKGFDINVELPANLGQGVLVAHGGSVVGYSLYLTKEEIVFSIRLDQEHVFRVRAPKSTAKKSSVVASLSPDGQMTLRVNEMETEAVELPSLLDRLPQEDLCFGFDNANPVDPQSPTKPYTKAVGKFKIQIAELDTNE